MTELTIRKLNKSFGEKQVLHDVSLCVSPGEIVCLMGPSGCGKTTLLNIAAGLLKPDSGEVLYGDPAPPPISVVFQEDRLAEDYSALSNVRMAVRHAVSDEVIRAHLEELGLAGSCTVPVRTLSGGMKRRIALCRAILAPSKLLLMDEALKGLDDAAKENAADYLLRHRNGRPLLFITHDDGEAALLGGRIVHFDKAADHAVRS